MFLVNAQKKLPATFRVYFLGDFHIGNRATVENRIARCVEIIRKDRRGFVVEMGDPIEAISINDKRFQSVLHEGKKKTLDAQIEQCVRIVSPIAHRVLAWLNGNHDDKWSEVWRVDKEICKQLYEKTGASIPFGGRSCRVQVADGAILFATHPGRGFYRSVAGDEKQKQTNDRIKLKRRLLAYPTDDCILSVMGHIHRMVVCGPDMGRIGVGGGLDYKQIYMSPMKNQQGQIPEQFRWFASSGGFLKRDVVSETFDETFDMGKHVENGEYPETISTYSERAGYGLTEFGMIKASFKQGALANVEKIVV